MKPLKYILVAIFLLAVLLLGLISFFGYWPLITQLYYNTTHRKQIIEESRQIIEKGHEVLQKQNVYYVRTALDYYKKDNDVYPASLELLVKDYIRYPDHITDDRTKKIFDYKTMDSGKSYELCAMFEQGMKCFGPDDPNEHP